MRCMLRIDIKIFISDVHLLTDLKDNIRDKNLWELQCQYEQNPTTEIMFVSTVILKAILTNENYIRSI